jgi:hypothetical protein
MSAVPHGTTVSFGGSSISDVMDFSASKAVVSVDCTCLDDDQMDNRAGLKNPTASVTYSTKSGSAFDVEEGETGTLSISVPLDETSTEVLSETMMVESIDFGGSPNTAQAVTLNFVSTAEEESGS